MNLTITGNLTTDLEVRTTPNATFARGTIASNRRWKGTDGQTKEEVVFLPVVIWGDQATNAAESVRKGDRVVAVGRLQQRSWETDTGERRQRIELVVEEIGPSLRWRTASVERSKARAADADPLF